MNGDTEEDRSWKSTPRGSRPGEPTKAQMDAGVKAMREHGRLFLADMVPRSWLERAVRETWKAMLQAGKGTGH